MGGGQEAAVGWREVCPATDGAAGSQDRAEWPVTERDEEEKKRRRASDPVLSLQRAAFSNTAPSAAGYGGDSETLTGW
jgi:hypothetical protein